MAFVIETIALALAVSGLLLQTRKDPSARPSWHNLSASGRIVLLLMVAASVSKVIRQRSDAMVQAQRETMLANTLDSTNQRLKETQGELRTTKIELSRQTVSTKDSLLVAGKQNTEAISTQQSLAFNALLGAAVVPSYGLVELKVRARVPDSSSVRLDISKGYNEFIADSYFPSFRYALAFGALFKFIDWTTPRPVKFEVALGDWDNDALVDRDVFSGRWVSDPTIVDRRVDASAQVLSNGLETRTDADGNKLLIRVAPQKQHLLALLQGPAKTQAIHAYIWINLRNVRDEETRREIANTAKTEVKSATAYYTISVLDNLCHKAVLQPSRLNVGWNLLQIQYAGTHALERVSCPSYVVR